MEAFPYLGRMIAYNNSDSAAVYLNLRKTRKQWVIVAMAIESMGAMIWARVAMYKAVTQSVLLYGSKIWVVTGEMLKVLTGFHHREAQRITGMMAKRGAGGEWGYSSAVEAMEAVGLQTIGVYIKRQQMNIAERVACRPVYALCTELEQIPVTSRLV